MAPARGRRPRPAPAVEASGNGHGRTDRQAVAHRGQAIPRNRGGPGSRAVPSGPCRRGAGIRSRAPSSSLAASVSGLNEDAAKKEKAETASQAPALASIITPHGLQPRDDAWFLEIDGREYRVGGLEKTLGSDGLKVALRLKVGDRFHLDSLDLAGTRTGGASSSARPRKRASRPTSSSATWAGCCSPWSRL